MERILLRVCLLPILLTSSQNGNVDEYETVPAPPQDLSSDCDIEDTKLLPDPWIETDDVTGYVDNLIAGKPLETFDGLLYEKFRQTHEFCDFLTSYEPEVGQWHYVPAVCVPAAECLESKPFFLTKWGNKTCRIVGHDSAGLYPDHISSIIAETFVCCPINGTKLWKHYQLANNQVKPDRSHTEFAEVPTSLEEYRGLWVPYYHVSGRNFDYLNKADQRKLTTFFNRKNYDAFNTAQVCGFARGEPLGVKDNRIIFSWFPYLCVKPEDCGKAKASGKDPLPPANPLWHQFCQQKFTPVQNPRRDVVYYEPLNHYPVSNRYHHCCHINDMGNKFLKTPNDVYVPVPQIPTFFNIAPGVRSVYKCEEYAKQVCRKSPDGSSMCVGGPFNPPKPGENPHMASLGVIVLKIMIFHCGGALVSLRYVLSAASCIHWWGYKVNVVMLGEHASSSYEYGKERFLLVTQIVQPNGYPPSFRYKPSKENRARPTSETIDIALYKLDREIEITRYIRPACLWYGHGQGWGNRTFDFLGWGSPDTYRSEYLNTLTSGLTQSKSCTSEFFKDDTGENPYYRVFGAPVSWQVCSKGYPDVNGENKGPCLLDHGGPLQEKMSKPYCSTLLLGILSTRNPCNPKTVPNVFINISNFLGAIEDELWGKYTFLDLTKQRFQKPSCGNAKEFFFFNKCKYGDDC
ncbi:uncharacterized protein LOC129000581 [Macrosteles quadrilineatus]|uniref:uncharacterized protein LOC129000581 n=1 Tax=Macrosteles quadrilineatus TaxID=74068 RepID=UPI0023E33637|nr:uncharacterized protein LOC129000581 [Macrosteles quadrilineatus]